MIIRIDNYLNIQKEEIATVQIEQAKNFSQKKNLLALQRDEQGEMEPGPVQSVQLDLMTTAPSWFEGRRREQLAYDEL